MKITWFKKAIHSNDTWAIILNHNLSKLGIENTQHLLRMTDLNINIVAHKINHPFWTEAIMTLAKVSKAFHEEHIERALTQSPFDNSMYMSDKVPRRGRRAEQPAKPFKRAQLPNRAQFLSSLKDLVNPDNKLMSDNELRMNHNIRDDDWLTVHRFNKAINNKLKTLNSQKIMVRNPDTGEREALKQPTLKQYLVKTKGTAYFLLGRK